MTLRNSLTCSGEWKISRYAALELRLHKLYLLDVDPDIIDLTIDEPVPSSSSVNTPEKTPKKRQRDPDVVEVDSL
jgi:hypothetical protein